MERPKPWVLNHEGTTDDDDDGYNDAKRARKCPWRSTGDNMEIWVKDKVMFSGGAEPYGTASLVKVGGWQKGK